MAISIGAVDPNNPDRLLSVRIDGEPSDTLLVSTDGAKTWKTIFTTKGDMLGFALSPDGSQIALGGPSDGLVLASTSDFAFHQVSAIGPSCLAWTAAGLYGCGLGKFVDGVHVGGFLTDTGSDVEGALSPLGSRHLELSGGENSRSDDVPGVLARRGANDRGGGRRGRGRRGTGGEVFRMSMRGARRRRWEDAGARVGRGAFVDRSSFVSTGARKPGKERDDPQDVLFASASHAIRTTPSMDATIRSEKFRALARSIDPARAKDLEARFRPLFVGEALALGTLLAAAYPALSAVIEATPEMVTTLAHEQLRGPRDKKTLRAILSKASGDPRDSERYMAALRRGMRAERLRIAARELLPLSLGGADIDRPPCAKSPRLAEVTIDLRVPLAEANERRRGEARDTAHGVRRAGALHGAGNGQARRERAQHRVRRRSRLPLRHRRRRSGRRGRGRTLLSLPRSCGRASREAHRRASAKAHRTGASGASICGFGRRVERALW